MVSILLFFSTFQDLKDYFNTNIDQTILNVTSMQEVWGAFNDGNSSMGKKVKINENSYVIDLSWLQIVGGT